MQFGKVDSAEGIDFTLTQDHPDSVFGAKGKSLPPIYVGCAKWNRQDLKGFYPRGTKDELSYYSTQFNSIELNAVFYNYSKAQIVKWRDKTPNGFKFFPKVSQRISHWGRLEGVDREVEDYCDAICAFENKLGMAFLQMNANFDCARNSNRLYRFLDNWPRGVPLAVEVRNTDWFDDPDYFKALERNNISHIITDTAGRRDLLHMRLTSPKVFVRYVGANHSSDYTRLDDWVGRLGEWVEKGVEDVYFFVHQNLELESPMLSKYLVEQLNDRLGYKLNVPQ